MVSSKELQASRRDLSVEDGDAAYDTEAEVAALVEANTGSGTFAKIWQFTVPAQQMYQWGFGPATLPRNQGYLTFANVDATTGFEDGLVRLIMADANENRRHVLTTLASNALHNSTNTTAQQALQTDINSMVPLPRSISGRRAVGEDSKLIIEFKTIQATTTVDETAFRIPATLYS